MAKLMLCLLAVSAVVSSGLAQTCGISTRMRPNRPHETEGQRIVGGQEARPNSFPWIVSLQTYSSHFCGGSLVHVGNDTHTDIIFTAAHCVYDGVKGLTVSAGAHNLRKPTSTQQTVKATKFVYHPQYDPDTTLNDVAVIKLDAPIRFGTGVTPVCLPSSGDKVTANTEATVAGWGLTKEDGDVSSILNQVGVPIISTRDCQSMYSKANIDIDGNAMICAGYKAGGKDSCQGDSGGPFTIKKNGANVLVGVVSFGVGCAREGLPGVYANVANYIPWFKQTIKSLSSLAG